MSRIVQQIYPELAGDEAKRRRHFSDYSDHRNVVLLGDPGAGKSYEFEKAAEADGGRFLTTRSFLNIPEFGPAPVLFIDALDERRAGRGDRATVDLVVQKLFAVRPSKVRISCRAADWLGETDLTAFRDYFDGNDGAVVLALQALTDGEQVSVLVGAECAKPEAFLAEARDHRMAAFLDNAESLRLLWKAVGESGREWPTTLKELYRLGTTVLLREADAKRTNSELGKYQAEELIVPAGELCAVRLLSDIAGISLEGGSDDQDYPSYRSLAPTGSELTLATLGRRVFRQGDKVNTVDYSHRTIAEYLAASWLAERVRAGLPLSRVRALIGVDGHPAAELRGLHAWLAVQLPEANDVLITADPFGVLTYGDAKSLEPAARQHLLNRLSILSREDPWFRSDNRSSRSLGALATEDMVEPFKAVLLDPGTKPDLRLLIIDALAAGTPLPEMREQLSRILWDERASLSERLSAFSALKGFGEKAVLEVAVAYRAKPAATQATAQLKGRMLVDLLGTQLVAADFVALMNETLACSDELSSGSFWNLADAVSHADLPHILTEFPLITEDDSVRRYSDRNLWELASIYEKLLLRMLGTKMDVGGDTLDRWLLIRQGLGVYRGSARSTEIGEALLKRSDLHPSLVESFVEKLHRSESRWKEHYRFAERTFGVIDGDAIFPEVVKRLMESDAGSEDEEIWYELAWSFVYGLRKDQSAAFEEIYLRAGTTAGLVAIREKSIAAPWSAPEAPLRRKKPDPERIRQVNITELGKEREKLRSGQHMGALMFTADVFFGRVE